MKRYSLKVWRESSDEIEIKMVESHDGDYADFNEAYDIISSLNERIEELEKEIDMLDNLYGGGK